ncbi:MFS transporter [Cadophora sp. MPI-SDFR-AT-0126]|nr:MFS transporter [Leotiomycetes sp. MPI-SDFR-AT-0126]
MDHIANSRHREGADIEKVVNSAHGDPPNDPPEMPAPRPIHGIKWATAYAAMLSTTFLFALDNTITANIQPSIINSLGDVAILPWIGVGFALGSMAVLPWGKAYGVFNMKYIYIFNIILFQIGSALCGAAPRMNILVVGRVIAGVGGSGMYSGTLTYVSFLTTAKERPAYLAGSTVVWGIGSVLGPVLGGAFAISSATWRWGFYINLVIGAVFTPAYLLLFPQVVPQPNRTFKQRCGMIDWTMTAIFLAGSCVFTMAISFGGTVYPWNSATEIALWTVAGVLFTASIVLTKYYPWVVTEHRLYPAHFLKNAILVTLQIQVYLSSGIVLALTYYIPIFFQFVRGDGPLDAGVRLLPLIISMVVVTMINAFLMPRFTLVSPWYIIGSSLVLSGCALMYTINETTPNASIYGYTILVGTGAGAYIVCGFAIHQSLVSASEISNAVSAMTIAQIIGLVTFLATSGTLYQNISIQKLSHILPNFSKDEILDLTTGTSSAAYKSFSAEEQEAIIPQIMDAMSNVWMFFLVAAALSFVLSFLLTVSSLEVVARIYSD